MENLWHIIFGRGQPGSLGGVWSWGWMPATCTCHLYGMRCDEPGVMVHRNAGIGP